MLMWTRQAPALTPLPGYKQEIKTHPRGTDGVRNSRCEASLAYVECGAQRVNDRLAGQERTCLLDAAALTPLHTRV